MLLRVRWVPYWTHSQFMDGLACTRAQGQTIEASNVVMELELERYMLQAYLLLDDSARQEVDRALQKTPFTLVTLSSYALPMDSDGLRRTRASTRAIQVFLRLCQVLGTIPTLKTAVVDLVDNLNLRIQGDVIQCLDGIKNISILGNEADIATDSRELARGLTAHPSIERIELWTPTMFYPTVLPVLATLPKLTSLVLAPGVTEANAYNDDASSDPEIGVRDLEALADLLPLVEMSPSFELKLHLFNVSSGVSTQRLCDLLAKAQLKRLALFKCRLGDTAPIVQALKVSRLEKLSLLGLRSFDTEAMDKVLARYVHNNVDLKELVLQIRRPTKKTAKLTLPAFHEALKTNYAMHAAHFLSSSDSKTGASSWDRDFEWNVQTLLALNRAGRGYVAVDPSNKRMGIRVLEQVGDNADCCFVHLRENPLLCVGHSPGSRAEARHIRDRKRSAKKQGSARCRRSQRRRK